MKWGGKSSSEGKEVLNISIMQWNAKIFVSGAEFVKNYCYLFRMRKSYLIGLFFLAVYTRVAAQAPAGVVAPEDVAFNAVYAGRAVPRVTGRILNLPAEELKGLTVTYTLVTPFSHFQDQKTCAPGADGSFSLVLDYPFPYQQIWLAVGDLFYAGIYVNDGLQLELDMAKIKPANGVQFNGVGVRYLGADGPLNEYLNNFVLFRRPEQLDLNGKAMTLLQTFRTAPDSAFRESRLCFDSLKMIGDDYIAKNPSPYGWIIGNEMLSDYYGQLCIAHMGKRMDDALWTKISQHKSYLISNSGSSFYNYLNMYLGTLPGAPMGAVPKDEVLIRRLDVNMHRLDSLFPPAKADFLKLRLATSTDVDEQKTVLEHTVGTMHTPWCITVEKDQYHKALEKIDEINKTFAESRRDVPKTGLGDPLFETPFGATLYHASGKALDFLKRLKESFPGKAIVIDRWATWCVPCLAEMPHSKKLQEEAKDMPVVFVYLCTINGSTESKWKSKVAELKQPGIHFLIDEQLDADLSHYFSFSGYPGYALIDRAGNYKPGAIQRISAVENKDALAALIQ